MKKIFSLLMLLTLALAACAPAAVDEPASSPVDNPEPSAPVEGGLDPAGSTMPANENFAPMPSDEGMTRGEAYLDDVELLTLESYPPQFTLNLKGNLPTPCYQLRIAVSEPDAENRVNVEVYSIADPDQACVQALAPFEVNYSLGSFPAGKYSLWINGEMAAEFEA